EALLGRTEIREHPVGVAEAGPGPRFQVLHQGGAIYHRGEALRQGDRQLGQLPRLARLGRRALARLLEHPLAEAPGLETGAVLEEDQAALMGVAQELGEELVSLRTLPLEGGVDLPHAVE